MPDLLTAAEVSPDDMALFEQECNRIESAWLGDLQARCPDELSGAGRAFPISEPAYTNKRPIDVALLERELVDFAPHRAAELDVLLAGKNLPALQALLAAGAITSVELVQVAYDRIRRYDLNRLNAVLALNPAALAQARTQDAARAAGRAQGPLWGIPILLKDNIGFAGMPTTAGAWVLRDLMLGDAFLTRRLIDAGAIILGKTNLSEWANFMDPCMPNGFSVIGGQTLSPYGPLDPSGSSTGSAVAVAAGYVAASIGSETSGSIISPARANGVVGLRPTLGLVSRSGVVPLVEALDTAGPMARTVTDAAILLNALVGVDPSDARTAAAAPWQGYDYTTALSAEQARSLRVGVILPIRAAAEFLAGRNVAAADEHALLAATFYPDFGGDPAVALAALERAGISAVPIADASLPPGYDTPLPLLSYGFRESAARFFAALGDAAPVRSLADVVALNAEDLANRAPYGQASVERSAQDALGAEAYARVAATSHALAAAWMRSVLTDHQVDLLVCGMLYTNRTGAAGVPALTVPAGLDPNGAPQGVVLSGAPFSEPHLLAVGFALERVLAGRVEPDLPGTLAAIDAMRTQ